MNVYTVTIVFWTTNYHHHYLSTTLIAGSFFHQLILSTTKTLWQMHDFGRNRFWSTVSFRSGVRLYFSFSWTFRTAVAKLTFHFFVCVLPGHMDKTNSILICICILRTFLLVLIWHWPHMRGWSYVANKMVNMPLLNENHIHCKSHTRRNIRTTLSAEIEPSDWIKEQKPKNGKTQRRTHILRR